MADRWRDATVYSDDEFRQLIVADKIDILVDLSGHSLGNRLPVFARKPAPVQVAGWGHATGTGLPTIDYLLSDPIVCPNTVRYLFAEKIFDLPCVMPPVDILMDRVSPSDAPFLSKGYITFGVFNRISKITDDALSLWARILHSVPGSRIMIKHVALDEASVRSQLLEKLTTRGILAERIVLLGATTRREHLEAFKNVDISLDPFPQNGGTSTLESLQVGVPVVGKLGNSIASRLTGSILNLIGMTEWVADTADEYLAIAVKFGSRPENAQDLAV